MLHEDITTGVILYGLTLDLDQIEGLDAEAYLAFDEIANSIPGITHVVPGDTVYVGDDIWARDTLLGAIALALDPDATPCALNLDRVAEAKASFEAALPKIRELDHPVIQAALAREPALFLTCCGPLPFASLSIGSVIPSSQSGSATYTFHSSQDMNQEWLPEGVDGASIANVEFSDVTKIDLAPERIERWKERVPTLSNPSIYLSVRYD